MPLLAQPDRAVKLFNMACTGCPIPTGSSSHGLRNNGPAVEERIVYRSNATACARISAFDEVYVFYCTVNPLKKATGASKLYINRIIQ